MDSVEKILLRASSDILDDEVQETFEKARDIFNVLGIDEDLKMVFSILIRRAQQEYSRKRYREEEGNV